MKVTLSKWMKTLVVAIAGCLAVVTAAAGADDAPTGTFNAVVEVTSSQGTRSMSVTIEVVNPMTLAEAMNLKRVLDSGQQALANAIRGASRGRMLLGTVAFPLDLVVAEKVDDGWKYVVVTPRNFRWDEVQLEEPSLAFPFAVAEFEVPEMGSGSGQLAPRAALSIGDDGRVAIDRFEGDSGRLKEIRRR